MNDPGARVLMLLGNNPYPDDPRVRNEAVALTAAAHRVTVLAPRERGQRRSEQLEGVRVLRYPRLRWGHGTVMQVFDHLAVAIVSLVGSLLVARRPGFDVVHVHNPPDTLGVVAAMWQRRGRLFVFDHHDLAAEMYLARAGRDRRGGAVYAALHRLERWCCRRADLVIASNGSYRRVEIDDYGVDPGRVAVVRNGPDLEQFPRRAERPARAGPHLVCYGGVIGRQDGVDHFVRAVHHVVRDRRRNDIRCLVAGDGDALPAARQLASELAVDDAIEFAGLLAFEDLVQRMADADVCVEPAPANEYNERSTTIKLMEYLAVGSPVVAYDLPEHRVTGGDCITYVPSGDVGAFGDAILDLVDDPVRRRALGEAGRRRVERCLAWPHQATALRRAYADLITRRLSR